MSSLLALWAAMAFVVAAPHSATDRVLATFDGGVVHADDVMREMRYLTNDERRYRDHMGMPEGKRWLDWIRRGALREIARREAERIGIEADAGVREAVRGAVRLWLLAQWREHCFGQPFSELTDMELQERLDAKPALSWPEGLRLSHLFRRAETDAEVAAANAELLALREQVNGLETFTTLAEAHSDSQTAGRGGKLGIMKRGDLPAAVETILYNIEPGSVSPPIAMRGGLHLFFVEARRPAGTQPQERRITLVRAQHHSEVRRACRDAVLEAAREASPVDRSDGRLSVGGWSIADTMLSEHYASDADGDLDAAIGRYVDDEQLFQAAVAWEGWDPVARRRIDDVRLDELLRQIVSKAVEAVLKLATDDELAAAFAALERPFRERRKLEVRALRGELPVDADPIAYLRQLERVAEALQESDADWDALASQVAGTSVHDLPPTDLLDVAGVLGPPVFERVKNAPVGTVSAPIQDGRIFWIVAMDRAIPARDMTFEESVPRLHRQIRKARSRAAAEAATSDLFTRYHFRLTAAGEARVAVSGETVATPDP